MSNNVEVQHISQYLDEFPTTPHKGIGTLNLTQYRESGFKVQPAQEIAKYTSPWSLGCLSSCLFGWHSLENIGFHKGPATLVPQGNFV